MKWNEICGVSRNWNEIFNGSNKWDEISKTNSKWDKKKLWLKWELWSANGNWKWNLEIEEVTKTEIYDVIRK